MRRAWILALSAVAAGALAASASGSQALHEAIHVERTFVVEDYCDVEGLDVEIVRVLDLRIQVVPHGPAGLAYFLQHGRQTEVLTSVASGTSLTSVATVTEKDQNVTVNDDGTLTILVLATGNAVLYGADGKAIARNPGQLRFELLIDEGDPSDPSDDVITRLGNVKGSTGRTDDFCAAAVPALS